MSEAGSRATGGMLYCSAASGLPLVSARSFNTVFLLDIDGTLALTDDLYREVFIEILTP